MTQSTLASLYEPSSPSPILALTPRWYIFRPNDLTPGTLLHYEGLLSSTVTEYIIINIYTNHLRSNKPATRKSFIEIRSTDTGASRQISAGYLCDNGRWSIDK